MAGSRGRATNRDAGEIARRKGEHLRIAASGEVESRTSAGWSDVHLVHDALPTIDASSVDVSATLLGRRLRLPVVITGMTGGHPDALAVNRTLARVAQRTGIAIGVGSQRAALRDRTLVPTYSIVREEAPEAFVIANVGVAQLVDQDAGTPISADDVRDLVAMVHADALTVHLNYLEESVQLEGQTRARGSEAALRALVRASPVPVIVKETGAGISKEVAVRARALGARAVDVGGLGGTSFAVIESMRAASAGDHRRAELGTLFGDWGIPTAVAVVGASGSRLPVIATGGVRSGLDAAKALALGASVVGVGRPLLQAALKGETACLEWLETFELELRTAIFLSGAHRASELARLPLVVTGDTRAWLDQLGYRLAPRTRVAARSGTRGARARS